MMRKTNKTVKSPIVSIIIPCYNSEYYIAECIDSVLAQNYKNIEIIVIDDGSTDNSLDILNNYKGITIYTQKNSGACVARNRGIKNSRGKYIKFLDSDDFLEPGVIAKQVKLAETLADNTIVYGDYYELRDDRKVYRNLFKPFSDQTSRLIIGYILTATPLHRKWMLEQVDGFDERFKNSQEWNLHIRLSSEGFIFYHHKLPILTYRIHDSADRISILKNKDENHILYEIQKTEMTKERISGNATGDIDAALAMKYWTIARKLYRSGDLDKAKLYVEKSKSISKNYKKYWTIKRRIFYKLFGFTATEKMVVAINILRKDRFI